MPDRWISQQVVREWLDSVRLGLAPGSIPADLPMLTVPVVPGLPLGLERLSLSVFQQCPKGKGDLVLVTADRGMSVIAKTMGFSVLFMAAENRQTCFGGIPYQTNWWNLFSRVVACCRVG
jgi:type IV secretory pathway protease TraF